MIKDIDDARLRLDYYPVQLPLETQFADMDALAHLNNVAIARFYENARVRFHMATFSGEGYSKPAEGMDVLVQANLRYLREGYFPDPVIVGTTVAHLGNSSYILHQGLFQNEQCLGICDSVFVYIKAGQSQPLPEEMRSRLQ